MLQRPTKVTAIAVARSQPGRVVRTAQQALAEQRSSLDYLQQPDEVNGAEFRRASIFDPLDAIQGSAGHAGTLARASLTSTASACESSSIVL